MTADPDLIRHFGTTGLKITALGFGAGHIGDASMTGKEAEKLLNAVADEGINLIDTARSYGLSEERIGKYLKKRRSDIVLSTKVGYGVYGVQDWTYEAVMRGVDEALKKLRTDYIDIVHLHTCTYHVLRSGEVTDALLECVNLGKVRVAAYSGDNFDLDTAIHSGRFGAVQASANLFDQRFIDHQLYTAKVKGMGVIAKRPIANAPWRYGLFPAGHYCETYWHRMRIMELDFGIPMDELALRFAAWTWGIDSCIVGTSDVARIRHNLELVRKGPLPAGMVHAIRSRFRECDHGWESQV
jgi:aryl-alcohol dehydrogenase-like predicted oxidoreductase